MIEIIAEIGVNHDGSVDKARQLVLSARDCGANWAKFQTFIAAQLATASAPTADYQRVHHSGDQQSLLARLELGSGAFRNLQSYCREIGIGFLSSPFDPESLAFLLSLGLKTLKIGSGEITNLPLLEQLGEAGVRVILSTGMSTLGEVETAVSALQRGGVGDVVLMHCVTQYPAPVTEVNLRAMVTLRQAFGLPVGYSDHTPGIEVATAAAALGATVIEKHLTLDPASPGPDHAASSTPAEFEALVQAIRNIEVALGDGIKRPAACELPNLVVARKSLVAARDLAAGSLIGDADLVIKRPGSGIAPQFLRRVVGQRLLRAVTQDTVLNWDDISHER